MPASFRYTKNFTGTGKTVYGNKFKWSPIQSVLSVIVYIQKFQYADLADSASIYFLSKTIFDNVTRFDIF